MDVDRSSLSINLHSVHLFCKHCIKVVAYSGQEDDATAPEDEGVEGLRVNEVSQLTIDRIVLDGLIDQRFLSQRVPCTIQGNDTSRSALCYHVDSNFTDGKKDHGGGRDAIGVNERSPEGREAGNGSK